MEYIKVTEGSNVGLLGKLSYDVHIAFHYMEEHSIASAELTNMGDYYYFNRLYVAPALRGKRIASMLLGGVVDWAKENNKAILCEINAYGDLSYEQLKEFYMRYGFKDCGTYLAFGDLRI